MNYGLYSLFLKRENSEEAKRINRLNFTQNLHVK